MRRPGAYLRLHGDRRGLKMTPTSRRREAVPQRQQAVLLRGPQPERLAIERLRCGDGFDVGCANMTGSSRGVRHARGFGRWRYDLRESRTHRAIRGHADDDRPITTVGR